MNKKNIQLTLFLAVCLIGFSFTSFRNYTSITKSVVIAAADTCISPTNITRSTVIGNGQVLDEACVEIDLNEGFETEDDVEYTAQIGSGNLNGSSLVPVVRNADTERVQLLVKPQSGTVSLRWVPERSEDWFYSCIVGYQLLREELNGNSWVSSSGFPKAIAGIDPTGAAYPQWSPTFQDSTYYVAYYTVVERGTNPLSDEIFFAYYAAASAYNTNFACAVKSGHGFTDNSIISGKKYRYKVTATANTELIGTGNWLEVTASTSGSLPIIETNLTRSETQLKPTVNVEWNASSLKGFYASYNVERSVDGTNFTRVNPKPIVYTSQFDSKDSLKNKIQNFYFSDTLPNITRKYYYRIAAKGYFNDIQNFQTKEIIVKKTYQYSPHIDSLKSVNTTQHRLFWKFPEYNNNNTLDSILVNNPYLLQVSQNNATYKNIVVGIPKNTRQATFNKSLLITQGAIDTTKTYYYRMGAITNSNDTLYSIAYIFIPPDKTPPAVPSSFAIEKANVVGGRQVYNLSWTAGNEPDLLGYIVKRRFGLTDSLYVVSNLKFSKTTTNGITTTTRVITTSAKDTINLKIEAYPKIYYFLYAVDENYNVSQPTIKEVEIVDNIRPVAPLIRKVRTESNNVKLSLTCSPEKGTIHKILRRIDNVTTWDTIRTYTPLQRDTSFTDTGVSANKEYFYVFLAYDQAGNESCANENKASFKNEYAPAECYQIMSAMIKNSTILKPIVLQTLTAVGNTSSNTIELTWTIDNTFSTKIKEFEIYKAEYLATDAANTVKEFLLKVIPYYPASSTTTSVSILYSDEFPEKNKINRYKIRSILTDGTLSDWRVVPVNY